MGPCECECTWPDLCSWCGSLVFDREETHHDASDADTRATAQALEKAAAARSHRARIKSELKSGELKLSEFFTASETDDVLGKMKVRALLISLPRVGTTTADAILADVHIAESRRVRGLGANQRAALVERFG